MTMRPLHVRVRAEGDLAEMEARVAAAGGDLDADWAALEGGRSTTGLAKGAAGARLLGQPLKDDSLLAPPSNPQARPRQRMGCLVGTGRGASRGGERAVSARKSPEQ
jgi:hypothetical protein